MRHHRHIDPTQYKWDCIRRTAAEHNLAVGDDLRSDDLRPGMTVLLYSEGYTMVGKFFGVTGNDEKYGEGGVKYETVKQCLLANGVQTLKGLEVRQDKHEGGYGHHSYLVFSDFNDKNDPNKPDPTCYIFEGRWSIGSGAKKVSFVQLLTEEEDAVRQERLVEEKRLREEKMRRNGARIRASHLAEELYKLMGQYPDIIKPEMVLTEVMVLKNKLEK